ncbi:hypothetical protein MSG28_010747 [Choristoneura fumiferana]|uniref:Uncharacterized protein n=1 Tax=Choristoneura fumiferana TaxID=7141 RepID=A0ACC0KPE8_CHOFU|nr:hypothetical protein MSG28_010747 [Choristoneura fumiferana]
MTMRLVIDSMSPFISPIDTMRSKGMNISIGITADMIDTIISAGFPVEVHDVTTEDGYVLAMHRIPYGRSGPTAERRPVVFLMHGVMSASSHFVSLGADHSIAHTGQQKLHYIGHSQGGTVFLVLNSMKTEYNEKIASAHLLAGVGYMANFPNAPLRTIAAMTTPIYALLLSMGLVEISLDALPILLPNDGQKASDYCFGDIKYQAFCDMIGIDIILEDSIIFALEMGGSSIKQIAHYGQNIKDQAFRRWDHGIIRNRIIYGSITPPSYDISKITIDVTMHYSLGDILLDERDVLAMAAVMPNTVPRQISRASFLHVDYIASSDVKELVTDYIIEKLDAAEGR